MKKIVISAAVILAIAFYALKNNTSSVPGSTAPISFSAPNTTQGNSSTTSSGYKDGTYTGPVTDAFYGNIQVQATISGGRLTNVTFLQYPSDRSESVQINQAADPILAQEAVQNQNAQVDIVTGATDSSNAFIQSLAAALNEAKS